jgi:predicted nucleotidyltransferase
MDIDDVIKAIKMWATNNPHVRRVYIFGSRVKDNFREDSDLDIALDIDKSENDTNRLATWVYESKAWKQELQTLIPSFNIDLQWFDPNGSTKTVEAGIKNGSILVYERNKHTKG